MAWLYVPELEVLNKELHPSLETTKPFVMSRGKPIQWRALCRKWEKDSFMKHLSGLMLEPSTVILGVEKWILSLEDSLVNHSVKLENKKELTMKDTFGLQYQKSLAKFDPQSSSWKTYQLSLNMREKLSLEIWPKWGIILHGVLFELQMPKHLIKGRGSFRSRSIPTPTTMDSQFLSSKRTVMLESLKEGKWRGVGLKDYVQMFPTPTATANQTCPSMIKKGGSFNNLLFPTPTSREMKGARTIQALKKSGRKPNNSLGDMINHLEKTNGKLNPEWVEWLMGWPIGWTECELVETE